ncbi:DNA translocase FtsK 4TM domain-containing protein, partial [Propylenella binzhouense]
MTYGTLADFHGGHGRFREFATRNGTKLAGLLLILVALAMTVSLASWHADDPSLSYAADGPVRNLLLGPGAIFADLAMQFLGLAILGLVLPVAGHGWKLFRLRVPRQIRIQSAYWLGGILLLSTALACFPTPAGWPLPVGLGGAVGDLVLRVPEAMSGEMMSAGARAAIGIVCGMVSLPLLVASFARTEPLAERLNRPRRQKAPKASPTQVAAPSSAFDGEDDDGESGRLRLLAGFLAHWGLSFRAGLARRFGSKRKRGGQPRIEPVASPAGGARREPVLSGFQGQRQADASPDGPAPDEDYPPEDDFYPAEEDDDDLAPPARDPAPVAGRRIQSPRIQAPAAAPLPAPRQGRIVPQP